MPNSREACAVLCCEFDLRKPITQNMKKIFCSPKEESKAKDKKYSNDFRKVVISNQIPNSNIPSDAKDLSINQTIVAYGNRQKCNSVRASKQLQFIAITETFIGNQALPVSICMQHSHHSVYSDHQSHNASSKSHNAFLFLHNVNCIQMCEIFFLNHRYSLILSPFILVHCTSVNLYDMIAGRLFQLHYNPSLNDICEWHDNPQRLDGIRSRYA